MEKDRLTRRLAVILHADVVGSTLLVQKNETLAHERIQAAFNNFAETITAYGGKAHEVRGDALVAEFSRASDAVPAAIAFQALNEKFNSSVSDDIQPQLRIGISLGEVIVADNTLTGAGVVGGQDVGNALASLENVGAGDLVPIPAEAKGEGRIVNALALIDGPFVEQIAVSFHIDVQIVDQGHGDGLFLSQMHLPFPESSLDLSRSHRHRVPLPIPKVPGEKVLPANRSGQKQPTEQQEKKGSRMGAVKTEPLFHRTS